MKLVYSNGHGIAEGRRGSWELSALPAFSFACDGLFWDDFGNHYVKHVSGGHVEMTDEEIGEVALWLIDSTPPPAPGPTPQQIEAGIVAAVQDHMDGQARLKGYDNIKSAALRAGYPGPFHAEGVIYAVWMDSCWAYCYSVLSAVVAGTRPVPTPAEVVAELPALVLP